MTEDFTVTWSSNDSDEDQLVYRLFYSPDNGSNWMLVGSELKDTEMQLNAGELPGTETGLFKVVVSDGFHNNEDESDEVFTIGRKTPIPVINTYLNGAEYFKGESVPLSGYVIDLEDGSIPDSNYSWSSDLDGQLGIGAEIPISSMSAGVHEITLTVTDSDGLTASQSVYLEILTDNDLDQIPDKWEMGNGLDHTKNDANEDPDGDGLSNFQEHQYDTDPFNYDTDFDSYFDLTETLAGSDPTDPTSTPPLHKVYLPILTR